MSAAFLQIEQSILGRRWEAKAYEERTALALAQRFELPDILARALAVRGIELEEAESFLAPRLRDQMPDPSLLQDMDKAVSRFIEALQKGEKIAVFGDYDVDGATSSALLIRFARSLGKDIRLYIPDRVSEGYGPNEEAMKRLKEEGTDLVICVDCGITAHGPLQTASDIGLDVIVIDHHTATPELPKAAAVVNPNRLDDKMMETLGHLAAVGVTYLFVVAVNRSLRQRNFYTEKNLEPNLTQWLDLVALGTVCDVVKLTGLNRAYVAQGLKVIQARGNVGIAALLDVAGAKNEIDVYTAGFILGPRLNAGGRIGSSDVGARLLATEDVSEATGLATRLHNLNDERRALEAQVLSEAESMVFADSAPLSFVASENWHPGVIGIVASRLKDKFQRPAIVIALDQEVGKGSGRSIGNIDLGSHVIAAQQSGLLINGGGHKMAAGLTVAREKLEELKEFLFEHIARQLEAQPFVPTLSLDGLVSIGGLTPDFVRQLGKLGPFGTGNAEPRVALADCKIVRADIVGENHVRVILSGAGQRLTGIAFRAMDNALGPSLLAAKGQPLHVAGHIRINKWQGRESVQIQIDDAAFPA